MIFLKIQTLVMNIPFKIRQFPLMNTQSHQLQQQQLKAIIIITIIITIVMSVYLILQSVN